MFGKLLKIQVASSIKSRWNNKLTIPTFNHILINTNKWNYEFEFITIVKIIITWLPVTILFSWNAFFCVKLRQLWHKQYKRKCLYDVLMTRVFTNKFLRTNTICKGISTFRWFGEGQVCKTIFNEANGIFCVLINTHNHELLRRVYFLFLLQKHV